MKSKDTAGLSAVAIVSALLLGSVLFTPVLGGVNAVQQASPYQTPAAANSTPSILYITGTFKVVSTKILATSISDGIRTTDSVTTVARNDSTSPGVITSMITVESVSHVNMTTGNGFSFGVGTFTGTIAGRGPGECTYRLSSTLTAQGTPKASSHSQHWLTECTGGLQGITETTTSIGSGVFSAVVMLSPPLPAPYPQFSPIARAMM